MQTPTQWNLPQHERPAFSVIAQHYFSATFVSLRLESRNEKCGTRVKNSFPLHFFLLL
jgi:hypothetical protein